MEIPRWTAIVYGYVRMSGYFVNILQFGLLNLPMKIFRPPDIYALLLNVTFLLY